MRFSLGAILSVTTGIVLAPFADIHELLDHMTGDTLLTHQIPRASEESTPEILRQHPGLADVVVPDGLNTWETVSAWIAGLAERFGAELELSPLAVQDHTRIDPIAELSMMRPDLPILAVRIGGED